MDETAGASVPGTEEKVTAIEQEVKSLLDDDCVVKLLKRFIDKTHWCYYLLRFPQVRMINVLFTGAPSGVFDMRNMTTIEGTFEDLIYTRIFRIPHRSRFYGKDRPASDFRDLSKFEEIMNPEELISERCFYEDMQYEEASSSLVFRNQFDYLQGVINDKITTEINPLSLLSALYKTAISRFAQNFYSKWYKTVPIDDVNSFFINMRPFLNCEKEKSYREIGEITCYCLHKDWFWHNSFFQGYDEVTAKIKAVTEDFKKSSFIASLFEPEQEDLSTGVSIDDIDVMDGVEFERFIGNIFSRQGFLVKFTPTTGDQGVDIIAEKEGVRVAIQAKRYTGKISNTAIQEITAGKTHHHCDKAIVVTNNYFTDSAFELAASNNVILWDRTILKEKLADGASSA